MAYCKRGMKCVDLTDASVRSTETPYRNGNFLMAYAHIAHECRIGTQTIIANGALLSGGGQRRRSRVRFRQLDQGPVGQRIAACYGARMLGEITAGKVRTVETFYTLQLSPASVVQPDLQIVWNPAFNPDPGPAVVLQFQFVLKW